MARVELNWDPFDQADPGPCIDVIITNSRAVIDAGRAIGLEYPAPRPMRALLDTGASVTVISKVFANSCKLFQTSEGSEITAIGATHRCGEHAGAISFPGTTLDHWMSSGSFQLNSQNNDPTRYSSAEISCEIGSSPSTVVLGE
jgi:hypothetical protein